MVRTALTTGLLRDGSGNMQQASGNKDEPTQQMRALQLQTRLTDSWFAWKRTGEQRHYDASVKAAQQLDRIHRRQFAAGTTIPIGIYDSSGTGYTISVDSVEDVIKSYPGADIFGFIRMSHDTAAYSAASYEHNWAMREEAKKRKVDFQHPALNDLLQHSFVPVPIPFTNRAIVNGISTNKALAVLGPIPISDKVSAQFVNWVRGPSLHNQLEDDYASGRPDTLTAKLHHLQLFAVSQITGIWQANPTPLGIARPSDLEAQVKEYYARRPKESISEIVRLTGVDVSDKYMKTVYSLMDEMTAAMVFNADPENGNIGRYSDSALRNFMLDVGSVGGTSADVLKAVYKGGGIDYYALWNVMARIDFSSERHWAAHEEDASHITENLYVHATPEQKLQYVAGMNLSRRALLLYQNFQTGNLQTVRRANDVSEQLQAVRLGELAPLDASEFGKYHNRFEPTILIMPFVRKLRQAQLALVYMAKAIAHQQIADTNENTAAIVERGKEAGAYMLSSVGALSKVIDAAGISVKLPVFQEGAPVLQDILEEARDRASQGRYSDDEMTKTGHDYLRILR